MNRLGLMRPIDRPAPRPARPTAFFPRKSIAELQAEAGADTLHRALGPVHLTALGIGAVIGAGIFVLTGQVAAVHAELGTLLATRGVKRLPLMSRKRGPLRAVHHWHVASSRVIWIQGGRRGEPAYPIAVLVDRATASPVLMVSTEGGMNIEEVAEQTPELIFKEPFCPDGGLMPYQVRKLAKHLGVSENTVKFHVRNILDKLHLHNRAQVVSYAIRNRIVESPGI